MNRRVVVAALVVVSLGAGLTAGWLLSRPPAAEPAPLPLPRPLPGFRLPDVRGVSHDIADWRGHFLLINFWATWCAPCRLEMPLLQALQQQGKGDAGVVVIGVAVDRQAPVETFLAESGITYPILVGQQEALQIAESLVPEFVGLPLSLLVSPAGQILQIHLGELHPEDIRTIAAIAAELAANRLNDQQASRRLEAALKRS